MLIISFSIGGNSLHISSKVEIPCFLLFFIFGDFARVACFGSFSTNFGGLFAIGVIGLTRWGPELDENKFSSSFLILANADFWSGLAIFGLSSIFSDNWLLGDWFAGIAIVFGCCCVKKNLDISFKLSSSFKFFQLILSPEGVIYVGGRDAAAFSFDWFGSYNKESK